MAWVKIPTEHHPIFLAALPRDPRISTLQMFGGLAAKVNGYMLGGLFARSAMVRLAPDDQRAALALDGAAPFDPMGRGAMKDTVLLPEAVMDEPAQLRDWLGRALAYTAALPPKAENRTPKVKKPAARADRGAVPIKPAAVKSASATAAPKPARTRPSPARPARTKAARTSARQTRARSR